MNFWQFVVNFRQIVVTRLWDLVVKFRQFVVNFKQFVVNLTPGMFFTPVPPQRYFCDFKAKIGFRTCLDLNP